jgi:hypothetical protein
MYFLNSRQAMTNTDTLGKILVGQDLAIVSNAGHVVREPV